MSDSKKLRNYFYGWQCRIRQQAVRKFDGRPSEGMRAQIILKPGDPAAGTVVTGLIKRNAKEITAEFSHIVRKTHDPNLRQQSAVKLLSSVYYQYPKEFKDCLSATFATDSALASRLAEARECELHFEQYQQQFSLSCSVKKFKEKSVEYQSTFWHNKMFNPVMPATITVLGFTPDWSCSKAVPDVADV